MKIKTNIRAGAGGPSSTSSSASGQKHTGIDDPVVVVVVPLGRCVGY